MFILPQSLPLKYIFYWYEFLVDTQCKDTCPSGTFKNIPQKTSGLCPSTCTLCESQIQCTACKDGFYLYNDICKDRCPKGHFINKKAKTCDGKINQLFQLFSLSDLGQEHNRLQDCLDFVQYMEDQIFITDDEVLAFSELNYCEVTCPTTYQCFDQKSQTSNPCTWRRQFALQCLRNDDGQATIRVVTNFMPDHCISTQDNCPEEAFIDFEVVFNRQDALQKTWVSSITQANAFRSSNQWLLDVNVKTLYTYVGYSYDDLNVREQIVGVALNGVPIMQGLSEYGLDPFYPKKYENLTNLQTIPVDDWSLSLSGFYQYYSASPSIFVMAMYLTTQVIPKPTDTEPQKIGLARDGHFILGPYNPETGKLWQQCEVDTCNGVYIKNKFYYATTLFHPYTIGCWGPGSLNKYGGQCSTKSFVCVEISDNGNSTATYTLMLSFLQLCIICLFTLLITHI
eukprot:403375051